MTGESEPPTPPPGPGGNVTVGYISNVTGVAVGHGAHANVMQVGNAPLDEIGKAVTSLNDRIDAMPEGVQKDDAKEAAKRLEAEARKGDHANEGRVRRWFAFLAEASFDAWDVAVNAFVNPIAGGGITRIV